MKKLDISSEEYRVYTFADGSTYRIDGPVWLHVTDTGSHRVMDAAGVMHRPTPGFVGVSWKPKPGSPEFVA